jgi:hypothetical protein
MFAVHLAEPWLPEKLKERLGAQLPAGLELVDVWTVPGYKKKETFGDIEVAEYLATVQDGAAATELRERAADLLARDEVTVTRGGDRPERTVDIRPMILLLRGEGRNRSRCGCVCGRAAMGRAGEEVRSLLRGRVRAYGARPSDGAVRYGQPTAALLTEPTALKRKWGGRHQIAAALGVASNEEFKYAI